MRIIARGDIIRFSHLGHIYEVRVADCGYSEMEGRTDERSLLTPQMICVRDDCPECAKAAEERGVPGYRTVAQTCFPLAGDSEAMEIHLRKRLVAPGAELDLVMVEVEGLMPDGAARQRLAEARERVEARVPAYP